jgi:hypothetical protein
MRTFGFVSLFALSLSLASCPALATEGQPWISFSSRIAQITTQIPNPRGVLVTASSACPNPAHDIAVGGECSAGQHALLQKTLLSSGAGSASYSCSFRQAEDNPAPLVVSVLCVLDAR